MSDLDARALEAFARYLSTLPEDARKLGRVVADSNVDSAVRAPLAGALNYLFKSLDLIPDGLEDLGFIDDSFVLRVAAAQVLEAERDGAGVLAKLAGEAELIHEFLGQDYERLERYVQKLADGSARGRSVAQILEDAAVRDDFVREVKQWAASYAPPSFARDSRSLVKLKSFLATRLPA